MIVINCVHYFTINISCYCGFELVLVINARWLDSNDDETCKDCEWIALVYVVVQFEVINASFKLGNRHRESLILTFRKVLLLNLPNGFI